MVETVEIAADADGILSKLRTQMPKSAEAAIAIGDYYLQRHDSDKALAEIRRGLSASANNVEIEKRSEDVYLVSNHDRAGSSDRRSAHEIVPKDVLVRVNHGRLLMAQGRFRTLRTSYARS